MSWNYRVMKRTFRLPSGDTEEQYGIYEVYYDKDGNPEGWSSEPVGVAGETFDEIVNDSIKYAESFKKPVLDYDSQGKPLGYMNVLDHFHHRIDVASKRTGIEKEKIVDELLTDGLENLIGVVDDFLIPRDDESLLEHYGWTMECKSPLEISKKDDPTSRATGNAAEVILEGLKHRWEYE